MKYSSALRRYMVRRIEEIESADIVVGIPSYNNDRTIAHVIRMVSHGLHTYFRNMRSVIIVSDGGSTDDTRDVVGEFQLKPWQEKIVAIYRGVPGKGTALRMVFEASRTLNARACMVVDADLRSINNKWVKRLLEPVLEKGFDFVAPIYQRHKYDGTITNNIVYDLCEAVFGKKIRQPIGGDFAFSKDLVKFYVEQDVWETDVAKFGIDVWLTIQAIVHEFKICQAHLGRKIHDPKDPSAHLGPMFRQVVWTLFQLMEETEDTWKKTSGTQPVPIFGKRSSLEPEPIEVNVRRLVNPFKMGLNHFGPLWREIFCSDSFQAIEAAASMDADQFRFPVDTWVRVVYEVAATFHHWKVNRKRLLDLMTPLYYGRVASFINETQGMDSRQAEKLVEAQGEHFVEAKDYLLSCWDNPPAGMPAVEREAEDPVYSDESI